MGQELLSRYVPNKVFMAAAEAKTGYPLMEGRLPAPDTKIFICRNYTCSLPLATPEEAMDLVLTKR
jgi:hypothetical protein